VNERTSKDGKAEPSTGNHETFSSNRPEKFDSAESADRGIPATIVQQSFGALESRA